MTTEDGEGGYSGSVPKGNLIRGTCKNLTKGIRHKMRDQALWYVAPGQAELRDEEVVAPQGDFVCLKALFGAISRGTERLIFSGRVPPDEFGRMRAPFMSGTFPFPVKYGYATVGRIEEGPRQGEIAFALHPHQSRFVVPAA